VGPIPNERPYRDLTEILRNSAFWTDYRLPEGTRFWGYFPIGDQTFRNLVNEWFGLNSPIENQVTCLRRRLFGQVPAPRSLTCARMLPTPRSKGICL
jgi:hypothetical protein